MTLSDYRIEPFTHGDSSHGDITHDVYHRGSGPCVLVAAEIPGITPRVVEFADRLVERGLSVALPSMFGTPGAPATARRQATTLARACISREFHCMAMRDSSPATDWLRALARRLRASNASHAGHGIGFVGMCLTGGFGLAMLLDDAVIAPVLSQPALPLPLGGARRASVGLSDRELSEVAARAADGCPVLGLRFTGDPAVPAERFSTLSSALGDAFIDVEITSPDPRHGIGRSAHSVLTEHLRDEPGHPTHDALNRVLDFLVERLEPQDG